MPKVTMKAAEMKNTAAMGYRGFATFMDIKQLNNLYCSSMGSPQSYEVNEFWHNFSVEDTNAGNPQILPNPCASSGTVCINSGYPNPSDCSTCNCPEPYGGATCADRYNGKRLTV